VGGIVVGSTIYCVSTSPSIPEIFVLSPWMHARTLRKHNASGHYIGGGIKIGKHFLYWGRRSHR